jgi:NhaP-type Na+/H+ or K+/H+ antiporter
LETALVIVFIGLLVFLAHLFVALFERTRIPDVLYLILIGIVIGPILQIVTPEDFGKVGNVFTIVALVVILFEAGLELSIESLHASLRNTAIITITSFAVTTLLATVAVYQFTDLSLSFSLFVGVILAGPAPAVVIPLIKHLRIRAETKTMLTLETPLGEALCIILGLFILDSMTFQTVQIGSLVGNLFSSFAVAVFIGGTGGYLWSVLLHRIRQLRHAIFTTPAFLFVLFGTTEALGFSGAVAALTFGVTLGNADAVHIPWLSRRFNLKPLVHNEIEKSFFGEIVFLIKTFFFVYVGLSFRFVEPWVVTLAIGLSVVIVVARLAAVWLSTTRRSSTLKDASLMGILVPKGTAAVVLASIPLQMGFAQGEEIQNIVYSVVVISILFTSLLVVLLERGMLLPLLRPLFPGYPVEAVSSQAAAPEGERPRKGNG